ncbi:hypothetical protein [Hymenobacter cavernae]|uniref:hypothetical protein n=1 Tax=Hymenobacter cavernae TaxID=2044852 RepID=UPI00166434A6|nr:hypothetical protein [Hymenobacter cavernae]
MLLILGSVGGALAQTTTFSYIGGNQTYTVPAGVTRIQVTAIGGAGGVAANQGLRATTA